MKNNRICNRRVRVESGINMNDRDYLENIFFLEQGLSNMYSNLLTKVSNDYLYEDFFELFEDSKDISRDIYDLLFKNGWLEVEKASNVKINDLNSKLNGMLADIESNFE